MGARKFPCAHCLTGTASQEGMTVNYSGEPRYFDPEPLRQKDPDQNPKASHNRWLTTLIVTAGVLILLVVWVLIRSS